MALLVALLVSVVFAAETFEGKTVIITGGSSGLGEATGRLMASKGANVVLFARSGANLNKVVSEIIAAGGSAALVVGDASNENDQRAAFDLAEKLYGGVDYVFANAALAGVMTVPELGSISKPEDFEKMRKLVDVNLMGYVISTNLAVEYFNKRGGGVILMTSSIASVIPASLYTVYPRGSVEGVLYGMEKAAVNALVRSMATYTSENIKSYGILPFVYTTVMVEEYASSLGATPDAFAAINVLFPGKSGDPKDFARIAEAFFDGTTAWPAYTNVLCDGDATFSSTFFENRLNTGAFEAPPKSEVFDVKGNPYKWPEEPKKEL